MVKTAHEINHIAGEDITLLDCPFCGGAAVVDRGNLYNAKAVKVKCTRCKSGTGAVIEGTYTIYHGERRKSFTEAQAALEVIGIWNSRSHSVEGVSV